MGSKGSDKKARAGEIPAARVGQKWRFSKAAVDAWLASGGTKTEG